MTSKTSALAAVYALAASLCEREVVWGVDNAVSRAARELGLSMRYTEHDARMQPLRDLCAEHGSISEAVHSNWVDEAEVVNRRVMLLSLAAAMAAPTEEDKADAETLRRAARLIETRQQNRSCWALQKAQGKSHWETTDLVRRYVDVMLGGETRSYHLPWVDHADQHLAMDSKEAMNIRVLLLCFAAELVLTGDL